MRSLKLGRKSADADRGVIYQTKGKGLIYTPVQSDGYLSSVEHGLTIRNNNPKTGCYSSRVDRIGLILVPLTRCSLFTYIDIT